MESTHSAIVIEDMVMEYLFKKVIAVFILMSVLLFEPVAAGPVKDGKKGSERVKKVKTIMKKKYSSDGKYKGKKRGKDPNAFYRFQPEKKVNRPLIDDGVHDPTANLSELQPPIKALKRLPSSTFGNGVNWVKALRSHKIEPRADRSGKKRQFTLSMNIRMPVRGSMNDVIFPHKTHTEWLACRNCHTGIFQMKKRGNPITMAKIVKGQYCGVCHGKVAFPIANCQRCHSAVKRKPSRTGRR
ncbi:MAG TPA: hypothetical protein ENG78_07670 [Acidiferrobacteraceae bacterium]|nr:hypothetical protein [Acidiferrobacteraceae bacterium]HEX20679.1 hypothetical protein [Acidiferrobacteraceae bacterium]